MFALLCTLTSVSLYYVISALHHVDDSVYDIGVSLGAMSLDHDEQHSDHNHSNTSWFSELNKLDLLRIVDSSLPVTMDTRKQIISPPKLKVPGTFLSQSNQQNNGVIGNNHSTTNHKQYHVIIAILTCLLLLSVTCNVVLIYWIT